MASIAYYFHDNAGTAYTVPYANVAQIVEASPAEKARGVRQRLQLLSTGAWIEVRDSNRMLIANETSTVP